LRRRAPRPGPHGRVLGQAPQRGAVRLARGARPGHGRGRPPHPRARSGAGGSAGVKGRHRHPGSAGFAAIVAALLIVVAVAVAVRALTGGSPAESDANGALPQAPGGSVATGSPSAPSTSEHLPMRGYLMSKGSQAVN